MATEDQPDYRQAVAELAARKGLRLRRGSHDESPLTIHFEDPERGNLIFSSPSFANAFGHLQSFPDRPPSA